MCFAGRSTLMGKTLPETTLEQRHVAVMRTFKNRPFPTAEEAQLLLSLIIFPAGAPSLLLVEEIVDMGIRGRATRTELRRFRRRGAMGGDR